jgi:DNA-binding transcriptional LysR family regulator
MLSAKDEAERAIAELRGGTKGRLILGAGTTGGMYVLPRVIQAHKTLWPETEILLHVGTTDQILEKLLQNVLDMGVVGGPVEDRRFTVETLCGDELVLIAAPSHPIASLAKVTLRDLGGMPFIVPETGSRTRQLVEKRLREAGVPLVIAMQLPGTEGVKRAVEGGLGIGMVSRYAVESEVQTGVLKRVAIEGWQLRRSMNLVHRAQKYFSPVGARFREFALSYGARHLDPLDRLADRSGRRRQAATARPPRARARGTSR